MATATFDDVKKIALLYEAALDRQPDTEGLNYWIGDFNRGISLQGIANSFYNAEEFRSQFTSFDDTAFVNQLYLNVLGRAADAEGLAYWLEDIQQRGRSHSDVLVSFAESAENQAQADNWISSLSYDGDSAAFANWILV